MSENWVCYETKVEENAAVVFADTDAVEIAGTPGYQTMCMVTIQVQQPDEYGFAGTDETDFLQAVEEELGRFLSKKLGLRHIGSLIFAGMRRIFFYGDGAKRFEKYVKKIMRKHAPGYVFETGDYPDPEGGVFREMLCPNAGELQVMGNHSVIDQLKEHGDRIDVPRKIEHYAYFPDKASIEKFEGQLDKEVYTVDNISEVDESDEDGAHSEQSVQFGIDFSETLSLDDHRIHESTLMLRELCEEAGGEYDGWQTQIVDEEGS